MLPEEHISTLEPMFEAVRTIQLHPPKYDERPNIINGMWHYPVPVGFFSSEHVTIVDSEEIFESTVIRTEEDDIIRLPVGLKSIKSIVKGNKIGFLNCSNENIDFFTLRTEWNRL